MGRRDLCPYRDHKQLSSLSTIFVSATGNARVVSNILFREVNYISTKIRPAALSWFCETLKSHDVAAAREARFSEWSAQVQNPTLQSVHYTLHTKENLIHQSPPCDLVSTAICCKGRVSIQSQSLYKLSSSAGFGQLHRPFRPPCSVPPYERDRNGTLFQARFFPWSNRNGKVCPC